MAIIYLAHTLLHGSNLPTLPVSFSAIAGPAKPGFTWHFSTQGLPACSIAGTCRELLPHIFTFIRQGGKLFSVALSLIRPATNSRPLAGVLPFAVRTFLPAETER